MAACRRFPVHLFHLPGNGQQVFCVRILPQGKQRPVEEAVDFLIPIAQCGSTAGSGGHIPDAGENLDLQAADILPGVPEVCKIIVVIVAAGIPATGAVRRWDQTPLLDRPF